MKYRRLGNSGLLVSELALGTMIFGENQARSTPEEEALQMIYRFLEAGGNHIDTADVYAGGRSEEILGKAMRGRRDQIVLASKVRFPTGAGPNDAGLSRYHMQKSLETSLRRLQTDVIDLLYLHGWDARTPLEETMRTMEDMVTAGKVRYIGVSNFKGWQVMKALAVSDRHGWCRFVAAQYQYSLIERDIEAEFEDLFESEGLGLVPWGPLGGGFLSGKYSRDRRPVAASEGRLATSPDEHEEAWHKRDIEKNWQIMTIMDEIVTEYGVTHSQVALAWLLARPVVASVILGARTLNQLEDNLKTSQVILSIEEIDRLDQISTPVQAYPYRLIRKD